MKQALKSSTQSNKKEKSDTEIKNDVLSELAFEPTVKATDIGVLVKNGVITLNGYVANYGEKWDAVHAAKRVSGVKAIADDIKVRLAESQIHTNGDIATAAADQMKWSTTTPSGKVTVTVRDGWVTLEGEVEKWYQKSGAENAVKYLAGVTGVTNIIAIKSLVEPEKIESKIKSAFVRSALMEAKSIEVTTDGSRVTLRGQVRNHAEKDEAERVAWAVPGVMMVDNQVTVEWHWGIPGIL